MIPSEADYILRDLSEIDIDNLREGRITRQVVREVEQRHQTHDKALYPYDLFIATELNRMLKAAKGKHNAEV